MDVTKEALVNAIAILQEASAVDMAGESDTALLFYVSATARLESLKPYLPAQHAEVMEQHIEGIKQRADVLRSDKSKKKASREFPKFPVEFAPQAVAPAMDDARHAVPLATVLRPYWLMRTLSASMQEGSFVTPDLYVSKHVWYQDGAMAAVTFIAPKVRFLAQLCEAMEPLQQVTSLNDKKKVMKALDTFLKHCEELKCSFEAEVGKTKSSDRIAQRSKLERGVFEFLHKGQSMLKSWKLQQDASYNALIAWAVNVLEQSQTLDRWTQYFMTAEESAPAVPVPVATAAAPKQGKTSFFSALGGGSSSQAQQEQLPTVEIIERLHNISAFFYYSLCSFLVQDMMILVERYMEKSRESFSRFLPVEVKVEE